MSYLNSILASIGDEKQSSPTIAKPPAVSRAALPARPNLTATSGGTQNPQAGKRKAEGELSNAPAKIARPLTPGQNGSAPQPAVASASGTTGYRGTARPEVGAKLGIKALQKSQPQTASSVAAPTIKTELKPSPLVKSATVPASNGPPPKKGSFKEILARANKLQQTTAPIGIIKHKQTEKLSKQERERLAQEQAAKGKAVAVRDKKLGVRSRTGSSEPSSRKVGEQSKEKRKLVDLGYSGTARPKSKSAEPQYKGTMGLARPGQNRPAPVEKASRYSRYADSDEDLEDEEELGYDESDLSDMEAGIFDVDEEEELALREAKKEDERERALENELKRKKAERRNKLTEMAAAAKKKKPIY